MQKEIRKELKAGLWFFLIYSLLNRFSVIPDFIHGALIGLGLCFITIGILPDKAYKSLKAFKHGLIK